MCVYIHTHVYILKKVQLLLIGINKQKALRMTYVKDCRIITDAQNNDMEY